MNAIAPTRPTLSPRIAAIAEDIRRRILAVTPEAAPEPFVPAPIIDHSVQAMQVREAARINAFLDAGGEIRMWRGHPETARKIERAVAIGSTLVIALVDGTDRACGVFGSMSGGYSLEWTPKRPEPEWTGER